jgi:hypothetical protein
MFITPCREYSVDFACRAETGEVIDTSFELFDFLLELVCLWVLRSSELIFEALESRFSVLPKQRNQLN